LMPNQSAPATYDAILFVETTTPARKNPSGTNDITFKAAAPNASGAIAYSDPDHPISVTLPKDWKITRAFRWGDNETTAVLAAPEQAEAGSLYFKMRVNPAKSEEETRKLLLDAPEAKVAQRTPGIPDYRIRPSSVEPRTVNGRPALSCVAEFTQNGERMIEYLTWISSDQATALFFARVPDAGLAALRGRLDPVIETLKLP